jgi:hypothetical protein
LTLVVINSLLVFLVLRRALHRDEIAFFGGLFYASAASILYVAIMGYHPVLGCTFLLFAIYLTIGFAKPLSGLRMASVGIFLSLSVLASTALIPPAMGFLLYILGRLVADSLKVKNIFPTLYSSIPLLILGAIVPIAYYLVRDSWLYAGAGWHRGMFTNYFHYLWATDAGPQDPYVLKSFFVQYSFAKSIRPSLPPLPRFYIDYLWTHDGFLAVGLLFASILFALGVLFATIYSRRVPMASWFYVTDGARTLVLIAIAIGTTAYLILAFGGLPTVGRAYIPIKIAETLLFAAMVDRVSTARVYQPRISQLLSSVMVAPLIVTGLLTSTVVFFKSADHLSEQPSRNYSNVPGCSVRCALYSESDLDSFIQLLKQSPGRNAEYVLLRAPATHWSYDDFHDTRLWAYVADLTLRADVKPVASLPIPVSKYFINEYEYFYLYLGNISERREAYPWLETFPAGRESIYKLSDLRAASKKATIPSDPRY